MRVFARPDGTVITVARKIDPGDPPVFPAQAIGYAATFDFDESTNAALATDLSTSTAPYSVVAGVLSKNGATVTPAAPGRFVQDKQAIAAMLAKLDADTSLTVAELRQALRVMLRWMVRRG